MTPRGQHTRALLACAVVAAGCGSGGGPVAFEVRATHEPACSFAGWERAAFTVTARERSVLEVEIVDRWPVADDLVTLMGPDEIRYLVSTVGRESLESGTSLDIAWSFGREAPGALAPDACDWVRDAHRELGRAWEDPQMCTYEVAATGDLGSSSNLFEPSCGADRGWRPIMLRRALPVTAERGRWTWLAAWVWAPADAGVELRADGNRWSLIVDGRRFAPEASPYPAWTLRARTRQ